MAATTSPINGLIVFESRLADASHLAPNTGASLASDYSQAGSRPGRVVPVDGQGLVPVITGGQGDETVTVRVARGGYAGDLAVVYSVDAGTTYRGWLTPRLRDFEALYLLWGTTDYVVHSSTAFERTGKVVTIYGQHASGGIECQSLALGGTWTAEGTVTSGATSAACLLVTPDASRLVAFTINANDKIATYFSSDEGSTWDTLGRAADINVTLPATPGAAEVTCGCFIGNDIVVFVGQSTGVIYQCASSDGGVSWTLVDTIVKWNRVSVSGRNGRAMLVGVNASTNDLEAVVLTSAFVPADQVAVTATVDSVGDQSAVAVLWDTDGTIYLYTTDVSPSATHWYRSDDGGSSWLGPRLVFSSEGANLIPQKQQLVPQGGEILVISNWQASPTTYEDSLCCTRLTQWSTLEVSGDLTTSWIPIVLPTQLANVTLTGANAWTLTSARGFQDAASGQGYYVYNNGNRALTPGCHFTMTCTSGGAITADESFVGLFACSASADYQIRIRFTATQFRVIDVVASAVLATVSLDMTIEREFFFCFSTTGQPFLAHKLPTDTDWTFVTLAAATDGAVGGAAFLAEFGSRFAGAGSAISAWRMLNVYQDVGSVLTGTSLLGKKLFGRPYPLPDVVDASGQLGYLAARGGLGLKGEVYEIPPAYDYAIENAMPAVSPSPFASEWRSKDTSAQIIAWDLGERSYLGGALGLVLQRTNIQTAYLEYHNGTTWVVLATYNGAEGFEALEYDIVGETLTPANGTDPSARPLHEDEFGDGYSWVNLEATYQRKILDNVGGWWTGTASDTVQSSCNLSGITGAETASGTFDLIASGGVLLAYLTARQVRRYWRVRIPAQDCPDGFFRAGLLGLGRFIPFAQAWGWGWRAEEEGVYDVFTDAARVEYRARRGESFRSAWTIDWTDGVPSANYYSGITAPYTGVSGGVALEPLGSVLSQLKGILRRTRGQTVPVVAIEGVPQGSTTITDPQMYLYGYLTGSVSSSRAQGTQGVDGVDRIDAIRVIAPGG